MRHKSSTHFWLEFYILSTKGAYQSTNLLKFHVGSRKSEILHVIGFPLSKSSAKRLQKSYLSKLKVTLTCGFKYDMRNLVNFHPTAQTSKNVILMGSFCPNYTRFYLQKYRLLIFHGTKQWYKILINSDLVVSKMAWGIGWTFIRALKSRKNCTLMDSFCPNHVILQL